MTIAKVSSYANYLSTVRNLRNSQESISDLSTQLNTGKISTDLAAYGADADRLLKLRADAVRRTAYTTQIDTVMPRVKATENVVDRLEAMATDLNNLTNLPAGAGQPYVGTVANNNKSQMQVTVDTTQSIFTQTADYTVTVQPSNTGKVGTYDITVNDGLGGRATMTVNAETVPPGSKDFDFVMNGGPGDGATIRLHFDKLEGPGTSNFSVSWPQNDGTRERILASMTDFVNYMNERVGDRYLFSGARYSTQPVNDIAAVKQQSKVTFDGTLGKIGDTYEVNVDGKQFIYTTDGTETSFNTIAANFASQITAANLGVTASALNGMVNLSGNTPGQAFNVTARLTPAPTVSNTVDPTVTTPVVIAGVPSQQDDIVFNAGSALGPNPSVDIGDVYTVSITDSVGKLHTYSVPVTPDDYDILAPAPQTPIPLQMDAVVQKLVTMINADPASGVTASSVSNPNGSSTLTLTAPLVGSATSAFTSTGTATNAANFNTVTAATLPAMGQPVTLPQLASDPNLPTYDVDYLSGSNPDAWARAVVTVDDDQTVTYGVTSNDQAFQKLAKALQMARIAVDNPGDYEKLMGQARSAIGDARDTLRALQSRVILSETSLNAARENHQARLTDLTGEIGKIENADPTEVSAKLQAAMNGLQAGYTVAGRTAQLSLINFLT
jgi:flagellin-like hook-associated protein FlgL